MRDLPSEFCPQCEGRGYRHLPEAGKVLRLMRQDAGVRQRTMANALDTTPQQLADWESGRRLVPQEIPEKWERVLREKGRHLPLRERVEARPAAPANAPAELPLRQDVDEAVRQESLPRSQPRTISDEQPQDWALIMREQQKPKR